MENYNSSSSGAKSSRNQSSYYPGNERQPQTPTTTPMYPSPSGTPLPTGMPAGSSMGPPPTVPSPYGEFVPQSVQSTQFTPGFLKTQIGRRVRVEFLIGTNGSTDRTGTLVGVGANYILIQIIGTNEIQLADLFAIKFVTFL